MKAMKPKLLHLASALALLLSLLALASCGGSSANGSGGEPSGESLTHVKGSSSTVSKAMLDHWMRMTVGGDFRANVGTKSPLGLVSEPADYPECITAAKKIVKRTFTGQLKLPESQIELKCHELYQAIKAQALNFLIGAQWLEREAEEQHIKLSEAELNKEFQRFSHENYKTKANQQQFLAERHWVVSDVLYMLKRNVLAARLGPSLQAKVKQAGGGERVFAKLATERYNELVAKTSCKSGYVVPGCKEYHEPATALPSPSVILEGFTQAAYG